MHLLANPAGMARRLPAGSADAHGFPGRVEQGAAELLLPAEAAPHRQLGRGPALRGGGRALARAPAQPPPRLLHRRARVGFLQCPLKARRRRPLRVLRLCLAVRGHLEAFLVRARIGRVGRGEAD